MSPSRPARPGQSARRDADAGRMLEELVSAVVALDDARATVLLSGLGEPLRLRALQLLTQLQGSSRAERHARLANIFGAGPPPPRAAVESLPGRLGVEVRRAEARGGRLPGGAEKSAPVRWARRLLLELGAP